MAFLRRIGHDEAMLVGKRVHSRAGCEILRILGAAVEHHDQRHGLLGRVGIARRHVELIAAPTLFGAERARDEIAGTCRFGGQGTARCVIGRVSALPQAGCYLPGSLPHLKCYRWGEMPR